MFQLGVHTWEDADEVVVWHGITGRHVRLHRDTLNAVRDRPADPRLAAVRARLDRNYLLDSSPRPPWLELVPCRSRLALFLPDEALLWLPVPGFRGPGGYGYRAFQLSPTGLMVWRSINDSRSISQVARHAKTDLLTVQSLCALLTGSELQALQLREEPPRSRDLSLQRLVDVPRPPNARPAHLTGPAGETTLTWYHLHEITDGSTHFDDRETTVAHGLGLPHPSLGGHRYGHALREALANRELLPDDGLIVEVGCGTGELAQAWLEHADAGPSYVRVDLSPELLRTQARKVPTTAGVLADGLHLPFADDSIDLIISNEVIADLEAVPVDPSAAEKTERQTRALDLMRRAGITPFVGLTWVNLGAFEFVQEIARVLRPGGAAWLSEFGVLHGPPAEAVQLDHPEVAIQAEHLAAVARHFGLQVSLEPLQDVLNIDLGVLQVSRSSWSAVRALARSRDVQLQARSWSVEALAQALPTRVEGLRAVPMNDEGPAPLITRFYAWTLQKSAL